MATYAETKIMAALLGHLGTLVLDPPLPVAWPRRKFAPPASGGYLKADHLPAQTRQGELMTDGQNHHTGLLQVSVYAPEYGDPTEVTEVAGAVVAHFKRGTDMTREGVVVTVSGPPWTSPALPEPGWYQIPVNIPYWARVPNPA